MTDIEVRTLCDNIRYKPKNQTLLLTLGPQKYSFFVILKDF